MVTEQFQIHAESVAVDTETSITTVRGFSLSELLAEFTVEDILQELDFSDVADYVTSELKDRED